MPEPSWREPPEESIGTQVENVRDLRSRDLLVRFIFGAVTSAVAGSLSILFSPIVGGVFLAFPAILAASLTLIAEEEDHKEAREDARGGAVGAVALAAFAGIGGRRSAQGRSASICAASERSVASSSWRPTSCTESGKPSAVNPAGTAAAGLPR